MLPCEGVKCLANGSFSICSTMPPFSRAKSTISLGALTFLGFKACGSLHLKTQKPGREYPGFSVCRETFCPERDRNPKKAPR